MSNINSVVKKFTYVHCVSRYYNVFKKSVFMKKNNGNIIQILPVRGLKTYPKRLPPGVQPYDPQAIPWARQVDPKGKILMLVIPVAAFALGTWQIKRLKWKTELVEDINRRISKEPVPLPLDPKEVAEMEYQKVTVTGTFDIEKEFLYGPRPCFINGEPDLNIVSKTGQGSYGFNLVTPFVLSDSGKRIMVNRGWIQTKEVKPEKRPWSRVTGEQKITGVVRTSEPPNMIAPHSDPKYNTWHIRDLEAMAGENDCLPIYIDAVAEHSIPDHLWAGQTRVQLRNEHLSYVLTWYALSLATSYMWYAKYVRPFRPAARI